MPNLKLLRIQAKVDELFKDKIDLSDTANPSEKENKFYTRALAALAVVMRCGIEYDVAAQSITDGYDTQYLISESVNTIVEAIFLEYWDKVYNAMEEKYPDSYPANIFKNVGRLREIVASL